MMLPALLEKALALAQAGAADLNEVSRLVALIKTAEGRIVTHEGYVEAIERAQERRLLEVDGPMELAAWRATQMELTGARRAVRALREDSAFRQEGLEALVARALARRAQEKEVRA